MKPSVSNKLTFLTLTLLLTTLSQAPLVAADGTSNAALDHVSKNANDIVINAAAMERFTGVGILALSVAAILL